MFVQMSDISKKTMQKNFDLFCVKQNGNFFNCWTSWLLSILWSIENLWTALFKVAVPIEDCGVNEENKYWPLSNSLRKYSRE